MEFVGTLAQAGGQPVVPGRIVDERLQRSPARQVIDVQQQLRHQEQVVRAMPRRFGRRRQGFELLGQVEAEQAAQQRGPLRVAQRSEHAAQRLQAGQAMQASPLVRMRLFLGEAPVQGVAVTQAGDLGRTGLAQRRQQGASVGVQRPQHHIAPPALDAQAAGKDRHATPRSLAVHVEAVEQHPVGAGHAPDRQRLRHQRAVLQTFFQSIANPAHEPPPRAHGRLACATLARNGMFIIGNPLFPQLRPLPSAAIAAMDVPSQSRGSAWRERISSIRRMLPRCSSPGRKSTLCPPQARCSSSLSSSRDSPMDWRQSNRRHRRRHSV